MRLTLYRLPEPQVEGQRHMVLAGPLGGTWVARSQGYPSRWTGGYYGAPQWRHLRAWRTPYHQDALRRLNPAWHVERHLRRRWASARGYDLRSPVFPSGHPVLTGRGGAIAACRAYWQAI